MVMRMAEIRSVIEVAGDPFIYTRLLLGPSRGLLILGVYLVCTFPEALVFRCFGVLHDLVPFVVPYLVGYMVPYMAP